MSELLEGRSIFLIGFMGAGKSTVAPILANLFDVDWMDTDLLVEQMARKTIPEIFDLHGEERFRKLEKQAVERAAERDEQIISVGGGAPIEDDNWAVMNREGIPCYLKLSPREILSRIDNPEERPLLANHNHSDLLTRITDLLERREDRYEEAEVVVGCDGDTPQGVAKKVFTEVKSKLK